jgi:hypothetical protein
MTAKRGRKWTIVSRVCAILSLVGAPLLIPLLGVGVGTVAAVECVRWWGAAGVTASAGAAALSVYATAGLFG